MDAPLFDPYHLPLNRNTSAAFGYGFATSDPELHPTVQITSLQSGWRLVPPSDPKLSQPIPLPQ